ncbi:MAG: type III pantothenate kinase [Rickettsiales bacterium]|nr:type III pantothenate kinase [Rickettsiales bacterium]
MLLAIDIGNTNIVFGIFEGKKNGKFLSSFRFETRHNRTADEYFALFQPLFQKLNVKNKITKVIISSVVPQTDFEIESFCKKHLSINPTKVSEVKNKLNIEIKIDNPNELGADRLVNAISAYDLIKKSCIVIDFGTATTFDVIDENGNYIGGVIASGVNLSIKALQEATSKLPKIAIKKPNKAIGKNTIEAMQAGVYYGYLGMVERIIDEIKSENKNIKKVIATGGLASFFKSKKIDLIDENLTLKGLQIIADMV